VGLAVLVAALGLLALLVLANEWGLQDKLEHLFVRGAPEPIRAIAVLPLENLTRGCLERLLRRRNDRCTDHRARQVSALRVIDFTEIFVAIQRLQETLPRLPRAACGGNRRRRGGAVGGTGADHRKVDLREKQICTFGAGATSAT